MLVVFAALAALQLLTVAGGGTTRLTVALVVLAGTGLCAAIPAPARMRLVVLVVCAAVGFGNLVQLLSGTHPALRLLWTSLIVHPDYDDHPNETAHLSAARQILAFLKQRGFTAVQHEHGSIGGESVGAASRRAVAAHR